MCISDRDNFAAAYEVGKLLGKKLRNEDKVAIIEGLAVADNARPVSYTHLVQGS